MSQDESLAQFFKHLKRVAVFNLEFDTYIWNRNAIPGIRGEFLVSDDNHPIGFREGHGYKISYRAI